MNIQPADRGELFRLIVESATDFAIFTTDTERRITSWNIGAERLMGWSETEIMGQPADMIYTPEDRERGKPEQESVMSLAEGRAEDQRWHMRKDGSRFWGDGLMLPLKNDAGDVQGFVKIFRDRTIELEAVERQKDSDRRKDEFLAILAHELRNPLAAIGNAAQLALKAGADPESLHWSKEVIARQVKNLSIMIDDLLDISRINQGKVQLKKEPLNVGPIIARAVESVSHLIEEKGHHLTVSVNMGSMRVNADPTRLEQVVTNLITNAVKYTDPGGSITITASTDAKSVFIKVTDNGIGLSPEMLPQVFDLFTQVEKTLDRARGGLGIGLAVVKRMVELHGGDVSVASNGLGKGSEFVIRLDAVNAREPLREQPVELPTKPKRMLVVDDNVDTAIGLARLLRINGHEVEVAHDGHTAIDMANTFQPDVILLDIGLPGLNGYEVASKLRDLETLRNSVFIAASGYDQEHDRERSRRAGFDHHISKPIDYNELLSLLTVARA